MFKTSSHNKKIASRFYAAALLFFVLVVFFAIALPQPAYACVSGFGLVCKAAAKVTNLWNGAVTQMVGNVTSNLATGFMNVSANLIGWILYIIFYFCVLIISLFIAILTYFIGVVLQINTQVVNSLAVQSGFTITLAVANMGFVLGIIVIAIMTIIRSQTYGMKQLLWKFVAAAILVNFSLVIGGVIINFANLFTSYFMAALPGGGAGASGFNTFASALSGAFLPANNPITSQAAMGAGLNGSASQVGSGVAQLIMVVLPVFQILFVLVMCLIVFIVLLVFLFMLLIRYIELTILMILMPIAWLFWVFPKFSHLWDKWWNEFLRWTFFAPIVMFFLYLAIATASAMNGGNSSGSVFGNTAGIAAVGYVAPTNIPVLSALSSILGSFVNTIIGQALQMLIVVGLAVGGMIAADKLSITGATAAVNSMKGRRVGVGKWMKNRGIEGGQAGWRNRRKIGAGIKNAVKNPKQALSGVGGFKGAAGSTWNAVKSAPGWLASRAGANIKSAVHPYLTNREEVDDAAKVVPKTKDERMAFIGSNVSTAKLMAAIDAMAKDNQLDKKTIEDMKVGYGQQTLGNWKDQNDGAIEDYEWKKESGGVDKLLKGDKKIRSAERDYNAVPAAQRATSPVAADAMDRLTKATNDFASKLEKKDMVAMGRGGGLTDGSEATKKLFTYFMDKAPQLAGSAFSGMKGEEPKKYQEKYNAAIEVRVTEIQSDAKMSAAEKKTAIERLVGDGDPKSELTRKSVKTQFNRSSGRNIEGIAPGGGGGGTAPTP